MRFGSSYRTPRTRWWRGVLSIAVVIVAVLLFSIVLSVVAVAIDMLLGLQDPEAMIEGRISMTPAMLAATNLSLIAAAALSLIAHRFINGVRVGYFHSVAPGLRWGWMWLSFALVAPLYLLFAASSFLDPAYQTLTFSGTTLAFFFVIILTTPLQAAAEEYMFRGVIQRSVGSWIRSPRWSFIVGTAASAAVFSAAHFAADIWLIVYYLLFGVLLSILTQRTGGVEAAIAIHTANNLFLLLVSAVTGQMDAGFDRSAGVGGPVMLVPVVILAVVLLVLSWVGKRHRLTTVTGGEAITADAAGPGTALPSASPWTGSGQQAGE
nr:CPBP family intramembrane glutamic endopeptidase [Brevibacterium yomogidense]